MMSPNSCLLPLACVKATSLGVVECVHCPQVSAKATTNLPAAQFDVSSHEPELCTRNHGTHIQPGEKGHFKLELK